MNEIGMPEISNEIRDRLFKAIFGRDTAEKLLRMKALTLEQIAEGTGLSIEEIKELKKKISK